MVKAAPWVQTTRRKQGKLIVLPRANAHPAI